MSSAQLKVAIKALGAHLNRQRDIDGYALLDKVSKLVRTECDEGALSATHASKLVQAERPMFKAVVEAAGAEAGFLLLRSRCREKHHRLPTNRWGRAAMLEIADEIRAENETAAPKGEVADPDPSNLSILD